MIRLNFKIDSLLTQVHRRLEPWREAESPLIVVDHFGTVLDASTEALALGISIGGPASEIAGLEMAIVFDGNPSNIHYTRAASAVWQLVESHFDNSSNQSASILRHISINEAWVEPNIALDLHCRADEPLNRIAEAAAKLATTIHDDVQSCLRYQISSTTQWLHSSASCEFPVRHSSQPSSGLFARRSSLDEEHTEIWQGCADVASSRSTASSDAIFTQGSDDEVQHHSSSLERHVDSTRPGLLLLDPSRRGLGGHVGALSIVDFVENATSELDIQNFVARWLSPLQPTHKYLGGILDRAQDEIEGGSRGAGTGP